MTYLRYSPDIESVDKDEQESAVRFAQGRGGYDVSFNPTSVDEIPS